MRKNRGSILSHFTASSLSDYDKSFYGWIHRIVFKNILLHHIKGDKERKWFGYNVPVSINSFFSTIFHLAELVEDIIASEM